MECIEYFNEYFNPDLDAFWTRPGILFGIDIPFSRTFKTIFGQLAERSRELNS